MEHNTNKIDMKKKRRTVENSGEENVRGNNDSSQAKDGCPCSTTNIQHSAEENLTLSEGSLNVDRLKQLLQRENQLKSELNDLELIKDTIKHCVNIDFYIDAHSSANYFDCITELLENENQIKKEEKCLEGIKESLRKWHEFCSEDDGTLVVRLKALLDKEKILEMEINNLDNIIQLEGDDMICIGGLNKLLNKQEELKKEIDDLQIIRQSLENCMGFSIGDNKDGFNLQHVIQLLEKENKLGQDMRNLENVKETLKTYIKPGFVCNHGSVYLAYLTQLLRKEKALHQELSDLENIRDSLQNLGQNTDFGRLLQLLQRDEQLQQDILNLEHARFTLEESKKSIKTHSKDDEDDLKCLKELLCKEENLTKELQDIENLQESLMKCIQTSVTNVSIAPNPEIYSLEHKLVGTNEHGSHFELVPSCSNKCILKSDVSIVNKNPKTHFEKSEEENSTDSNLEDRETSPQMVYQNGGSNNEDSIYFQRIKPLFKEEIQLDEEVSDLKKLQSCLKTCIQSGTCNKDRRYLDILKQRLEDKVKVEQEDPAKHLEKDQEKHKKQNSTDGNLEDREANPQTVYQNGGSNNEDSIYFQRIKSLFKEELQLDEEVSDMKKVQSFLKTRIQNRLKQHLEDKEKLVQEDPAEQLEKDQQRNKEQNSTDSNLEDRYLKELHSFLKTCIQHRKCNKDGRYLEVLVQYLEEEVKLVQEVSKLTEFKTSLEKPAPKHIPEVKPEQRNNIMENGDKQCLTRSRISNDETELFKKEQQLEKEICVLNNLKAYFQRCRDASRKDVDDASYTKRLDRLLQMDAQYSKEIASLTRIEDTFKRSMSTGVTHKGTRYLERLQNLLRNERQLQNEVQQLVDIEKVFEEHLHEKSGGTDGRQMEMLSHFKGTVNHSTSEKGNGTFVEPVCRYKLTSPEKIVKIPQTKSYFQHAPIVQQQEERQGNKREARKKELCQAYVQHKGVPNKLLEDDCLVKIENIRLNAKEIVDVPLMLKHMDLHSKNNSLGEAHEYLSDKLEELLLEQEHVEQTIGGPMKRELDRLKRRSAELERNLYNRTRIMEASERSYERELVKEGLVIAEKNICDLTFVNDGLRREVLVLNQRCVRMEELLVNEKRSEINNYKSM